MQYAATSNLTGNIFSNSQADCRTSYAAKATAQEAFLIKVESSSRAGDRMQHAGSHTEEPISSTADSGVPPTFPEKLMSLLNNSDVDDAMRWLPDGDAFCIQPQRLVERVLEPHFRCKYESFTRRLNRWGFRRFAGSQVPPDTIAYFERSFHRDKPEDLCNITGCKQRASHRYISKSKHTIRRELSNNAGTQSEGEVSAQGGGRGIVEHSFLGRESQSEEVAHYAEPFEQIVQSSLQENTVANLLARARVQQSAATSVSSVREGDLQSAVEMLLLRARAASSFQQPNPTRIELSANRAGSGFGPLELHNLLSGSSYHSMLPVRIGRSDLMPAEVALFSSRLGFTVPGDNASEAAILACLLASQSTNFAAPLPTSTITGATTTRNLLESLLQGQRTSSAVAPVSLINLPPILSSLLGRRTGMNYSNADSATEGQLLQLYLMEQERQLRRQNQSGSERN